MQGQSSVSHVFDEKDVFSLEFIRVEASFDEDFTCAFLSFVGADFDEIADNSEVKFSNDVSVEHEGTFEETDGNNFDFLSVFILRFKVMIEGVDFGSHFVNDSGALFLVVELAETESFVSFYFRPEWLH